MKKTPKFYALFLCALTLTIASQVLANETAQSATAQRTLTLESTHLKAHVSKADGALSVYDKRSKQWYHSVHTSAHYQVEAIKQNAQQIEISLKDSTNSFKATWSFHDEATLACVLTGDTKQQISEAGLAYPLPLSMSVEDSYLVLPDSGGFLFKADGSDIPPVRLNQMPTYTLYQHYHAMMAMFGFTDLTNGVVFVFDTPADVQYTLTPFDSKQAGKGYSPAIAWRPSKGKLGYTRKVRLHFSDQGGFVSLAKYYRKDVIQKGNHKSLKEKAKERPSVKKLVGAPHAWISSLTATRSNELIDDMKNHGIDKMVIKTFAHADFPGYRKKGAPVETNEKKHDKFLKRAEKHGYLVGKYMTYSSIRPYEKDEEWRAIFWNYLMLRDDNYLPYSGILQANGKRLTGWKNQGVRVSDKFGLEELIPAHMDFYKDFYLKHNALFMDVEGALRLMECYDPERPYDRAENMTIRQKRAEYFRDFNSDWAVGTETGVEYLLPYYDWVEGPPTAATYIDYKATHKNKKSPYYMGDWNRVDNNPPVLTKLCLADPISKKYGYNPAMRIPLYELVHGDQIVSVCRWEYPNNKMTDIWKLKDLFNMLWGTPPAYGITPSIWEKQKPQIVESIDTVCSWIEKVGYDELVDFTYLSEDKMVQKSVFSSGRSIIVNFKDTSFRHQGRRIPSMGYYLK